MFLTCLIIYVHEYVLIFTVYINFTYLLFVYHTPGDCLLGGPGRGTWDVGDVRDVKDVGREGRVGCGGREGREGREVSKTPTGRSFFHFS